MSTSADVMLGAVMARGVASPHTPVPWCIAIQAVDGSCSLFYRNLYIVFLPCAERHCRGQKEKPVGQSPSVHPRREMKRAVSGDYSCARCGASAKHFIRSSNRPWLSNFVCAALALPIRLFFFAAEEGAAPAHAERVHGATRPRGGPRTSAPRRTALATPARAHRCAG